MHRLNTVQSLQPNELLFNIRLNISTLWQMQNNQWAQYKTLSPRTEYAQRIWWLFIHGKST